MNKAEDGFTLLETLLSIAIVLIVSSLLVVASNTALRGASQSVRVISTAAMLTRIDRHIRLRTDAVHIPYWADAAPYIDALTGELFQSRFGSHIKSIKTVFDTQKVPRGIEVIYVYNNLEMRTVALLPSIAIMSTVR